MHILAGVERTSVALSTNNALAKGIVGRTIGLFGRRFETPYPPTVAHHDFFSPRART